MLFEDGEQPVTVLTLQTGRHENSPDHVLKDIGITRDAHKLADHHSATSQIAAEPQAHLDVLDRTIQVAVLKVSVRSCLDDPDHLPSP